MLAISYTLSCAYIHLTVLGSGAVRNCFSTGNHTAKLSGSCDTSQITQCIWDIGFELLSDGLFARKAYTCTVSCNQIINFMNLQNRPILNLLFFFKLKYLIYRYFISSYLVVCGTFKQLVNFFPSGKEQRLLFLIFVLVCFGAIPGSPLVMGC